MEEEKGRFVLLIWEEVPEKTNLYMIPEAVYYTRMKDVDTLHGVYDNQSGQKVTSKQRSAFNLIYVAVSAKAHAQAMLKEIPGAKAADLGFLSQYKAKITKKRPISDVTVVKVVHTGILL